MSETLEETGCQMYHEVDPESLSCSKCNRSFILGTHTIAIVAKIIDLCQHCAVVRGRYRGLVVAFAPMVIYHLSGHMGEPDI